MCGYGFEGNAPPAACPACGAGAEAFEPEAPPKAPAPQDAEERFVIVGGGVAALEAAKAIRRRRPSAPLTMLCGEAHPPYNRPGLPGVVAEGRKLEDLYLEPKSFYEQQNIDLRLGVTAEAIDPCRQTVALSGGGSLPYTKLLLATGATPFNPVKSGHGAIPVKVLRRYEDALDLAGYCEGKTLVLVGGGILGLEAAAALHKRGAKVTVVELAERILPLQTDKEASLMLSRALKKLGIGLITGASVTQATGEGVLLGDGTGLPAQLVLASLGVRSQVDLAVALGLELGRGIVVDAFMRSSRPGIWAAGDCAEYAGRVQALAGAARAMGGVAGASMCGDESAPYTPFVPATVYNIPEFSLFSAGSVAGEPDESLFYGDRSGTRYRRLLFTGGRLCGALYVGGSPPAAAMKALAAGAAPGDSLPLLLV